MHAIKGGWVGQAFALASSNDSGGRKSRIRRSKEERKEMVESYIKKYQKSNNGNFPSLNLTHKEVGGSFYTVREIVREIIQENRVLAPPKVFVDGHDHSGFFELHPLGSISMEPQTDSSVLDRIHIVTQSMPNQCQLTSEERISSSRGGDLAVNELSKVAEKDEGSDTASTSHAAPNKSQDTSLEEVSNSREQLPRPKIYDFENEKTVNGGELPEEDPEFDPVVTNGVPIHHQDNSKEAILLFSQKFDGPGNQRLSGEQYVKSNNQMVDFEKRKEAGQQITMESVAMEILDREKDGGKELEASQAVTSHMNSNVVVETFPLRPLFRTFHDMDGESGEVCETAETLENKATQQDEISSIQSSTALVNEKDEKKHLHSTLELNGEYRDDNAVLNLQNSSLESSNISTVVGAAVLDIGDVQDFESKDPLPDGTKDVDSADSLISKDSTSIERKSSDQDNIGLEKGSDLVLDRINSETWEEASKKSIQPENNPILALIKTFISALVKFCTE